MKTQLISLFTGGLMALMASQSQGAILQAHTSACGSFGTCDDSAFQTAAAGIALTLLDFHDTTGVDDANGDSTPDSLGSSFSPDVTFSSVASSTFGGTDSAYVNHEGEIGPLGVWDGILGIDFTTGVTAVGFGTVEIESPLETIRLYSGLTLLLEIAAISSDWFDYAGFVATGGDSITRIEIEGDHFAIQNISYGTMAPAVPVPAAGLLLLSAFGGLAAARRRRRS